MSTSVHLNLVSIYFSEGESHSPVFCKGENIFISNNALSYEISRIFAFIFQVCCMSFYDIVLDFIIMDSFDDLANPPYVLTSVLQNGWLTDSFKESVRA